METTRILWSGLTGKTGREAMEQLKYVPGAEIVAGIKRQISGANDVVLNGSLFDGVNWLSYDTGLFGIGGLIETARRLDIDVIVDFSHPDVFAKVVDLAAHTHTPLVSGTSGLSKRQMKMLYAATEQIPIFRGGNFRFRVKKFIDEAVKLALSSNGDLTLYESFYEGKRLPSETSEVIKRRIYEATGKTIKVQSWANLPRENLSCHWELDPGIKSREKLECHTIGFGELAEDVLRIAKVMAKKSVKTGEFYDLDELWDELVSYAIW